MPKRGYFPNHFLVWILYSALGNERYGSPIHCLDERATVQQLAKVSRANQRTVKSKKSAHEEMRASLVDRLESLLELKQQESDSMRKAKEEEMRSQAAYRQQKLENHKHAERLRHYQSLIAGKDTLIASLAPHVSNPAILKILMDAEANKQEYVVKCEELLQTASSTCEESAPVMVVEESDCHTTATTTTTTTTVSDTSSTPRRKRRTAEEVAQDSLDTSLIQVEKAEATIAKLNAKSSLNTHEVNSLASAQSRLLTHQEKILSAQKVLEQSAAKKTKQG